MRQLCNIEETILKTFDKNMPRHLHHNIIMSSLSPIFLSPRNKAHTPVYIPRVFFPTMPFTHPHISPPTVYVSFLSLILAQLCWFCRRRMARRRTARWRECRGVWCKLVRRRFASRAIDTVGTCGSWCAGYGCTFDIVSDICIVAVNIILFLLHLSNHPRHLARCVLIFAIIGTLVCWW